MLKKIVPLAVLVLLGSGCSLLSRDKQPGNITLSWYCVANSQSGTQTCQKRNIRDGVPADDVILETIVIPVDQPVPVVVVSSSPHHPPANAGDAVPWTRQPLSSVNSIDEPSSLQVENLGPAPREARDTMKVWHRSESKAVPIDSAVASSGYTLQLAAFATRERCDRFVSRQRPAELAVETRDIGSRGAVWCIVTHGHFASLKEATLASKEYGEKYSTLSFWVRNLASIAELEVSR